MANEWQLDKKERSHKKILSVASRFIRKNGLINSSVANVMKAAGLTVGGFYAHFSSKEDLIVQAFRSMTEHVMSFSSKLQQPAGPQRTREFLKLYLSEKHRDEPETGCHMAALALEFAREDAKLRKVFAEELRKMVNLRQKEFSSEKYKVSDEEVLAVMSMLVGALVLARATVGDSISNKILDSARKYIERRL